MQRKNLISLHEAIEIALLSKTNRTASFEEIAKFIEARDLCPIRDGNIPLSTQIMLRSTKSRGVHTHLFEQISPDSIRLRNLA